MLHARHAGLAIIGSSQHDAVRTGCATLSEEIVLASGRACLLLPLDCPPKPVGRRIVVGWNGSREAIRALADAMPLLMEADAVLVIVVEEPKTRGLLHGEEPGADICRHLVRYGVPVTLEQVPEAPAGETLLGKARELSADLLVMGWYGHSKISEIILGGATRTVLDRSAVRRVPVLLSQ